MTGSATAGESDYLNRKERLGSQGEGDVLPDHGQRPRDGDTRGRARRGPRLINTPARAAEAITAAMITGVEITSAQGQAMEQNDQTPDTANSSPWRKSVAQASACALLRRALEIRGLATRVRQGWAEE